MCFTTKTRQSRCAARVGCHGLTVTALRASNMHTLSRPTRFGASPARRIQTDCDCRRKAGTLPTPSQPQTTMETVRRNYSGVGQHLAQQVPLCRQRRRGLAIATARPDLSSEAALLDAACRQKVVPFSMLRVARKWRTVKREGALLDAACRQNVAREGGGSASSSATRRLDVEGG